MGFDLHGKMPGGKVPQIVDWDDEKSKDAYFKWQEETKGAYFRNNSWWWRPLWDFVCEVCADIITEDEHNSGHYNDGYLIDADRALAISTRLIHLIDQGEVKKFEKKYMKMLNFLPDENCWLCHGTGKRKDMKVKNGCNSCHGTGKIRPSECNYPFSEDNVQDFATFCKYSGGFEIC
jgi:hypothetical protein